MGSMKVRQAVIAMKTRDYLDWENSGRAAREECPLDIICLEQVKVLEAAPVLEWLSRIAGALGEHCPFRCYFEGRYPACYSDDCVLLKEFEAFKKELAGE